MCKTLLLYVFALLFVYFRNDEPCIGDVMRKFAPFLKLYSEYVKNFDSAMETMTYWLDKCPRFQQIVKDIQVPSLQ